MDRRSFLLSAAALPACARLSGLGVPLSVLRPGMDEGHALRDARRLPEPGGEIRCEVAVLGSGVAGLTAAWRLAREGLGDVRVVAGPELHGNAAAGAMAGNAHPRGAHYLPLPSRESMHVREMLHAAGVILDDPGAEAPEYDESAVVHAPRERLYVDGRWQDGLLAEGPRFAGEAAQRERFFATTAALAASVGSDGRPAFAVPIALSSVDGRWRGLDGFSFAAWLDRKGFTAPGLRAYLDYACRDEFGATPERVSAWIGLHYFAAVRGRGRSLGEGALLTWADGLNPLLRQLQPATLLAGSAWQVRERARDVEVLVVDGGRSTRLIAKRVVCAMPLHVAARVVEGIAGYGFDAAELPDSAPWMVANFLMKRFPREQGEAPLSWDNVVHGSPALGYVVSTHQLIRAARPERTVFTAYRCLADRSPQAARQWLASASPSELHAAAAVDLAEVYGVELWRHAEAVELCLRGHGMAVPAPGFLGNASLVALREADGRLLFAHGDLSGYSVFEEAAWWGWRAAAKILG